MKSHALILWTVVTGLSLIGGLGMLVSGCGVLNPVAHPSAEGPGRLRWKDLGPTPLGEKGYTPQGMTWVDGCLLLANTWKNTKSRVYEMDPRTMRILGTFDMPAHAVHTSGLAYDGHDLWAVDYRSNRCYKIDLQSSFNTGEAHVLGSFATGLKGTSACCFISWEGEQRLVVSDFKHSRKTYIVRHEEALRHGTMDGQVVFAYTNQGFSQGLLWDGVYLYESENRLGRDILNAMDPVALKKTGSACQAIVRRFNAPGRGVEDLAWDGFHFYTSDEKSLRFYRAPLPATVRPLSLH